MPTTFLMLPPQSELTREWARRLAEAAPELEIIAPETMEGAEQAIAGADGAYGRIPPALLARADKLRWLQAPQAAPPAGFYYPELIAHPVVITNMRDDAERAVRAGLAVIEAVSRLPGREDLSVQLGIATGLAVVGDLIGGAAQECGVAGETPNSCRPAAGPGRAERADHRRSDTPADRRTVRSRRSGPQHTPASGQPQRALRVLGERRGQPVRGIALGETPLVGREEDPASAA